jgi:hypothetical protein
MSVLFDVQTLREAQAPFRRRRCEGVIVVKCNWPELDGWLLLCLPTTVTLDKATLNKATSVVT